MFAKESHAAAADAQTPRSQRYNASIVVVMLVVVKVAAGVP